MNAKGFVHKYGDNVDTDVIIPARYLNTADANELAKHCMEDIDATFVEKVAKGDIMVAGWNFGCGSSREHAPLVIKTCGTGCVIAKSFARIFYRNAINIGRHSGVRSRGGRNSGGRSRSAWTLTPASSRMSPPVKPTRAEPFPAFIQNIIKKGGLLASLKEM